MRECVTFIHAADLHLGAPFQGLAAEDERVGRELAEATYLAWTRIVDAAIDRAVDFVILAGDLYDAGDPSLRSQLALRAEAQRLSAEGIPLVVVRGNHDPLGGWSAGLTMPEGVHVFSSGCTQRFEVVAEDGFVCAVYGRSYQVSAETSDFTPGYIREPSDTVAVGLLHANVGNNPDYDPYAPCTLQSLATGPMDYWALGHIHKHEVLSTDPYVVYAGSPQGLNPKETGEHGCCVVTLARGGVTAFEHLDVAPVAWMAGDVDITDAESVDRVEALVNARLDELRAAAGRSAVSRLRLIGRAPVHGDLARPGVLPQLADAIRAEHAARVPWMWLDRLEDRTAAVIDVSALAEAPEFSGEVVRVATDLARDANALDALFAEVTGPLLEKLPGHEPATGRIELLEAARDRALDLLLADDGGAS